MTKYECICGIITEIEPIDIGRDNNIGCCNMIFSVRAHNRKVVDFIVDNDTYTIDNITLGVGDDIIGFYDSGLVTPAIHPPQYRAVVMAKRVIGRNIKLKKFDRNYLSYDKKLQLDISPLTQIIMRNNQKYLCDFSGQDVAVVYKDSTKTIPVIARPSQIIILCR